MNVLIYYKGVPNELIDTLWNVNREYYLELLKGTKN